MTKKELRSIIRARKKELGADTLKIMSANAASLIEIDPDYINSNIIMIYHPLWDEVDIIQRCTQDVAGLVFVVPCVGQALNVRKQRVADLRRGALAALCHIHARKVRGNAREHREQKRRQGA